MKSEDVEKLERLLNETTFDLLSVEEREWVTDILGSEERFSALQKIEYNLSALELKSNLEPEERILNSLKKKIHRYSDQTSTWYSFLNIKIPAYATALFVVIASALTAWISQNPKIPQKIANASIIKTDTVYISKVDTVFSEKVIYRQARVATQSFKEIQTARAIEKVAPVSTGVSMKDKEELNKLLVSGSD